MCGAGLGLHENTGWRGQLQGSPATRAPGEGYCCPGSCSTGLSSPSGSVLASKRSWTRTNPGLSLSWFFFSLFVCWDLNSGDRSQTCWVMHFLPTWLALGIHSHSVAFDTFGATSSLLYHLLVSHLFCPDTDSLTKGACPKSLSRPSGETFGMVLEHPVPADRNWQELLPHGGRGWREHTCDSF